MQPRPQGAFPWLWRWDSKAREKAPWARGWGKCKTVLLHYKQHCKKGGQNATSSPGRFSLALEVGLQSQGKAPCGRSWGKWSINWRRLATLSGRVQKIGIFF